MDTATETLPQAESDLDSDLSSEPTTLAEICRRKLEELNNRPKPTPEQIEAENARRRAEEEREYHYRREGIVRQFMDTVGKSYQACRLKTFIADKPEKTKVIESLTEYIAAWPADGTGANLIFFGPVGTGKDHLAVATAGQIVWNNLIAARWVSGGELFGDIRDRMDDDRTEISLIRSMQSPALLILSDPLPAFGELGSHMATMLLRVIDARYREGKTTWVTINVADDAEADRRMGAATWDRLCHGAWKIKCAWPSHRKPAKTINC